MTMTLKNKFYTLLVAMIGSLLTMACTFEQDEFFDESASLRITHLNENLKARLVNQSHATGQNGWVMQYFVAGTDDYDFEGFNILASFDASGKVTLASNHRYLRNGNAGKYTEASSTYEMLREEGPVLGFNTWNDIISVFVDPVDPSKAPSAIVNDGEGMNGDVNLVLDAFNAYDVLFHGERHQAEARLVPCDRPWQQYLDDVAALKDKITNQTVTSYYVTQGVDTMYFTGLSKGVFVYGERISDPLLKKTLSCVFTPAGFRINHTDTLSGIPFHEFTLTQDNSRLLSENGLVQVIPCWDLYTVTHAAVWKMDPALFSAEQQNLFAQMDQEIKKHNTAWSIESIGIGQSSGSNKVNGLVVTFYTNTQKTKTNTAGLAMTTSRPQYGQYIVVVDASDKVDKNMETIVKKATQFEALTRQFAATLAGKYSVVPNNYFLPTGGDFTAIEGGTTFRLQ